MKIPNKITPCPIVEAILEIRFDSNTPPDAIFGIVYDKLKDKYPNVEKLPILQLPEIVRSKDAQLIFKPHYKLSGDGFVFQIGPKVLNLASVDNYVGWELFSREINESFKVVSELNIVEKVFRVGIRYINFFDFDIFDKIDLNILIRTEPLQANQFALKAEIPSNNFLNILNIINNAEVRIGNVFKKGSVIDIDTIRQEEFDTFFDKMGSIIASAHEEEKKLFFNLLKEDYLSTLNPKY